MADPEKSAVLALPRMKGVVYDGGAVFRSCDRCPTELVLAPTTKLLLDAGAALYCPMCMLLIAVTGEDVVHVEGNTDLGLDRLVEGTFPRGRPA